MLEKQMHNPGWLRLVALAALLLVGVGPTAAPADEDEGAAQDPARIRVAAVAFGEHRSDECFNDAFIDEVAERSNLRVERKLHPATLGEEALFEHPVAVMAGERAFELTEKQVEHLAAYLKRGGFLIASANCSAPRWDASFRKAIAAALPDAALKPIGNDHPLMSTLFKIEKPRVGKKADGPPLLGLTLGERLVMAYSPVGLNDSYGMRSECCCCGQAEVLNARLINANAVVYAATH